MSTSVSSILLSLILLDLIYFQALPTSSGTVRLLPFSLVPGISFNSPTFSKAIATIAKQQNTSNNATTSLSKGKKKKDIIIGMFSLILFLHSLSH